MVRDFALRLCWCDSAGADRRAVSVKRNRPRYTFQVGDVLALGRRLPLCATVRSAWNVCGVDAFPRSLLGEKRELIRRVYAIKHEPKSRPKLEVHYRRAVLSRLFAMQEDHNPTAVLEFRKEITFQPNFLI